MKKGLLFLAFVLLSYSLSAQSPISYSAEFVVGVGVGKGPLATLTPEFVAQYSLGSGFAVGLGAGVRLATPCDQYITKRGSNERMFCGEIDLPTFVRLGYGKGVLFANVDLGYAIGILSAYSGGMVPGGTKECCYNGLFAEPQIGLRLGDNGALSLGVLLQESIVKHHTTIENGEFGTPSYSMATEVKTLNIYTPAVTLRYVLNF